MGAGVADPLVEADTGNETVHIGTEPDPYLDGARTRVRGGRGRRRAGPGAARAGGPHTCGEGPNEIGRERIATKILNTRIRSPALNRSRIAR